jgi:hypothetical protein
LSNKQNFSAKRKFLYQFSSTNHHIILTHSILVGLTPLIPIPFLDDWVKSMFLRGMVRQISTARGVTLNAAQVEALIQEDFWDSCLEGCIGIFGYILRELLSKIFFFLEWRRAFNLVAITYYTGFLIDAALQDGYPLASEDGSTTAAARLREAVRRARYQSNLRLFQRLVRENIRPLAFLRAAVSLAGRSLASLPRLLAGLPGAVWRGIRSAPDQFARGAVSFWMRLRSTPRRVMESLAQLGQSLLRKQKQPEKNAVERMAQALQAALLKMDPGHFDELHARLQTEISRAAQPGSA